MRLNPIAALLELWAMLKAQKHDTEGKFTSGAEGRAQAKQQGKPKKQGEPEKQGKTAEELPRDAQGRKAVGTDANGKPVYELPTEHFDGHFEEDANGHISFVDHPLTGTFHPPSRKKKDQGMNWKSKPRRMATYERDGNACVWCGVTAEDGNKITLDHLTTYHNYGSNKEANLLTCCLSCNSHRQDKSINEFAEIAAALVGHGVTGQDILRHLKERVETPLTRKDVANALGRMRQHKTWIEAVRDVTPKAKANRPKIHAHVHKPETW